MYRLGVLILTFILGINHVYSQQLILNEVSQGNNSAEYVEFVVIGSSTCSTPVPSIDLRKVIIDDNNGYFAPGSGTGIAAGAIRFGDIPFWSAIPQGTYIVIYNESDRNSLIPPDDISLTDGNCRLIIPASSNLLEVTTVNSPSTASNLYPSNSSWIAGGNWAPLAMSNSNDSFQIPNLAVNGTPLHAVSWGNNSTNAIIYFSGAATSKVYSFNNIISNNWNDQQNWIAGDVGINETPGMANSPENDAWIGTMNPECGLVSPLVLNITVQNETCTGECNGQATVSVVNGNSNYSYTWSNGNTTQTASGLCEGNYQVEVSDLNGCPNTTTQTINVSTQNSSIQVTIDPVAQLNTSSSNVQLVPSQLGGVWTSMSCGNCVSSSGQFSPQISGVGVFEICYDLNSICPTSVCISVQVVNDCNPQITDETIQICKEDSTQIFSNWENLSGVYSQTFIDVNGCDSVHTIFLSKFPSEDIFENKIICSGDSVKIGSDWVNYSGDYSIEEYSNVGCKIKHFFSVIEQKCDDNEFFIYIPNAFTPDGGKTNNFFEPIITGGYLKEGFIFNRWGEIIIHLNQNNTQWDGKYIKGENVPDGLYQYMIKAVSENGDEYIKNGFVSVIK